MTDTYAVDEKEAARLIRTLDKIEGRKTDPRVDAIADAAVRPATVNGSSSVGLRTSAGNSWAAGLTDAERLVVDLASTIKGRVSRAEIAHVVGLEPRRVDEILDQLVIVDPEVGLRLTHLRGAAQEVEQGHYEKS